MSIQTDISRAFTGGCLPFKMPNVEKDYNKKFYVTNFRFYPQFWFMQKKYKFTKDVKNSHF